MEIYRRSEKDNDIMLNYALFTDSAPFRSGGRGCNILTYNLLQVVPELFSLVVTRRPFPSTARQYVRCKILVHMSSAGFGGSRLGWPTKALLDWSLFLADMPRIICRINEARADRILAFCGADWRILPQIWLLSVFYRKPIDLYLVDDFASAAKLAGSEWQVRAAEFWERVVVKKANRVLTISEGYKRHIAEKHQRGAQWLPVAIPSNQSPSRKAARISLRKRIVFIGSVNELYLAPLVELAHLLQSRNANGEDWKLVVVTIGTPRKLIEASPLGDILEIVDGSAREKLEAEISGAYALFVPYSSHPSVAVMIRTSFPTKLTDCLVAGRPVIIYGPRESSIVQYAELNGLPLTATTVQELDSTLDAVGRIDNDVVTDKYTRAIHTWHSRAMIAQALERDVKAGS